MARMNHSLRRAHLTSEHIQTTAISVSSKASHAVFPTSCVDSVNGWLSSAGLGPMFHLSWWTCSGF